MECHLASTRRLAGLRAIKGALVSAITNRRLTPPARQTHSHTRAARRKVHRRNALGNIWPGTARTAKRVGVRAHGPNSSGHPPTGGSVQLMQKVVTTQGVGYTNRRSNRPSEGEGLKGRQPEVQHLLLFRAWQRVSARPAGSLRVRLEREGHLQRSRSPRNEKRQDSYMVRSAGAAGRRSGPVAVRGRCPAGCVARRADRQIEHDARR